MQISYLKGLQIQESGNLKEEKLTLKKTEAHSNLMSATELSKKDFEHKSAHVLKNFTGTKGRRILSSRSQSRNRKVPAYFTCKKSGHIARDCYKSHTCKNCRKVGHTEKFCRSNKNPASVTEPMLGRSPSKALLHRFHAKWSSIETSNWYWIHRFVDQPRFCGRECYGLLSRTNFRVRWPMGSTFVSLLSW